MNAADTRLAAAARAGISPTGEIVEEIRAGRMVILVDDEGRENEGDLIIAAEHASAASINFMARHARGLICLTLTRQACDRLRLAPMVPRNGSKHSTAFTVSIEAAEGTTTGISAADRAHTVRTAAAPGAVAADLVRPGHVFPLQAEDGGVLVRAGHTEAGTDLARLAGCTPASVICEVMNEDGTMARLDDLRRFAQEHGLKVGTIADLIEYRSRSESTVERIHSRPLQAWGGSFQVHTYRDLHGASLHMALVLGAWGPGEAVPVRVHEHASVLDSLRMPRPTHSWSLADSLEYMVAQGRGVVVLLHCAESTEQLLGRLLENGAPLPKVLRPSADFRTYGIGAQILKDCDVARISLLGTARPMPSMAGYGLEVVDIVSQHTARPAP